MEAARTTARFLLSELRNGEGRLLRSWQGGRANLLAYAEDYAALLEGLVTLAEVDDVIWLAEARTIADEMIRLFHDEERGGFFTTGTDAEALIVRPKDVQDNATPSENSLAANGLLRLATLTGESRYEELATAWVRGMAPLLGEHPTAFAHLLGALERVVIPPLEVAVIGSLDDADAHALWHEVTHRVLPGAVTLRAAPGEGANESPLLADRPLVDGNPTAYVCQHYACQLPVTNPGALRAQLDAAVSSASV
jgi:uncharacterized protein YyaL (SSP411 family)